MRQFFLTDNFILFHHPTTNNYYSVPINRINIQDLYWNIILTTVFGGVPSLVDCFKALSLKLRRIFDGMNSLKLPEAFHFRGFRSPSSTVNAVPPPSTTLPTASDFSTDNSRSEEGCFFPMSLIISREPFRLSGDIRLSLDIDDERLPLHGIMFSDSISLCEISMYVQAYFGSFLYFSRC